MGATKKPRKQYKPRAIAANPLSIAFCGARMLDAIDIARFMSQLRGAVSAILGGQSCRDDWTCLFDAVNTMEQLAPLVAEKGWRGWIEQVQADVIAAHDQRLAGISDVHAQGLHDLADNFARALERVTCSQMLQAQEAAARKVNAALRRGKSTGSVRVIDPQEMRAV
jgi:hypothetical protein